MFLPGQLLRPIPTGGELQACLTPVELWIDKNELC